MTEELSREEYLYMAKLTEQAEQYGDMVEYMRKVAKMDTDLSVEERNLLSVAYKNHIGAPRASWRVLSSIEQKELHKGNDRNVRLIQNYRQTVEKQLREICQEILSLLDQHLIPHAASGESQVFYYKMYVDRGIWGVVAWFVVDLGWVGLRAVIAGGVVWRPSRFRGEWWVG